MVMVRDIPITREGGGAGWRHEPQKKEKNRVRKREGKAIGLA